MPPPVDDEPNSFSGAQQGAGSAARYDSPIDNIAFALIRVKEVDARGSIPINIQQSTPANFGLSLARKICKSSGYGEKEWPVDLSDISFPARRSPGGTAT